MSNMKEFITRTTNVASISDRVRLFYAAIFFAVYAMVALIFFLSLPGFVEAASIGRPPAQNYAGLVGYWTFDGPDVAGGTIRDRSGQGNHGSAVGISTSTFFSLGKIGQALRFDGVDDYITVSNEANFDFDRTNPFSISAWLNYADFGTIVSKTNNGGNFPGFDLSIENNQRLKFTMIGTAGGCGTDCVVNLTPVGSILPSVWYHVMLTSDGSGTKEGVRLFIDGVDRTVVGGSDISSSMLNDTQLRIASNPAAAGAFKSIVDDVRIYNRALRADEIARLYNAGTSKFNTAPSNPSLDRGLTGWWTFDGVDTSSGTIMDRSGRGNHASMRNMATATAFVIGKKGQAIKLDGVDDYVDTTRPLSNFITASEHTISIHAYFKGRVVSDGDRQGIIEDAGGIVGIERDNIAGFAESILTTGCEVSVLRDYWIHLIQVHRAGLITTYYTNPDGSRSTCSFSQGDFSPLTNNLRIGISSTGSEFDGLIDDVRVYNRGISAAEVDQLFDQTNAKMNTSVSKGLAGPGSGLVGWWTFDGPDVAGGTIRDRSGQGNHGSAIGISTSTFFSLGKMGQALKFDGANDFIDVPDNTYSDLSVCAWIKHDSFALDSTIVGGGGISDFFIVYVSTGLVAVYDGVGYRFAATVMKPGVWYQACMTYIGSTKELSIYMDGVREYNNVGTATYNNGTISRIGYNGSYYFQGNMDDVRVYNRALSPDEIRKLYNQGK